MIAAAREIFADAGYAGASMEEIARCAGITKATLYDHFPSKCALHVWLLERQCEDLLQLGEAAVGGCGTPDERAARTFDAVFRYVETNPYAWRMLFSETTGDPDVAAQHRRILAEAATGIAGLLFAQLAPRYAEPVRETQLASAVGELIRGGLQAITLWWMEHPETPRHELVALCLDVYWLGMSRFQEGTSRREPLPPATLDDGGPGV